jgi:hypothetical protein
VRFRGTVTRTGRGGGGVAAIIIITTAAKAAPLVAGRAARRCAGIDAVVGDATSAADVEKVLGKSVTFGTSDLQDMRASALQDGDTRRV